MKNYANSFKNFYNTRTEQLSSLMTSHRELGTKLSKINRVVKAKEGSNSNVNRRQIANLKKTMSVMINNMKTIAKKWGNINKKAKKVERDMILKMAKNLSSRGKKKVSSTSKK
jgi:hypothetical protein